MKVLVTLINETECFNEEETEILLNGVKRHDLPKNLIEKVETLGIRDWCLRGIPKNLKALLDNANLTK